MRVRESLDSPSLDDITRSSIDRRGYGTQSSNIPHTFPATVETTRYRRVPVCAKEALVRVGDDALDRFANAQAALLAGDPRGSSERLAATIRIVWTPESLDAPPTDQWTRERCFLRIAGEVMDLCDHASSDDIYWTQADASACLTIVGALLQWEREERPFD